MNHRVRQLAAFAAVATIGIAAACSKDDPPTGPNVTRTTFVATMNGTNEVPAVTTTASGTATLVKFNNDSITFVIQVASIDSVILSHIHAGDANTASGAILFAFPATNPPTSFTTLATLRTGTITPTSTFSGSFTWDSLLTRLSAGTAYVNVHTRKNTGGEIRAQLVQTP